MLYAMTETTPLEVDLQVVSRNQIETGIGTVIKSEVVFRGTPRTVYSSSAFTDIGLAQYVAAIESA